MAPGWKPGRGSNVPRGFKSHLLCFGKAPNEKKAGIPMDPFVSTILKQGLVFAACAGAVVFLAYCGVKFQKLQYCLQNNIYPSGLE